MLQEEYFDIVDDNDRITGKASRAECHGNPALIHRTVHVIVLHPDGKILLQKRRADKDIQPGKWDTAVGGHISSGENYEDAVIRELEEELGIRVNFSELRYIGDMKIRNNIESENVRIFSIVYNGKINFQAEEIEDVKFWDTEELKNAIHKTPEIFTPNLIRELKEFAGIINLAL